MTRQVQVQVQVCQLSEWEWMRWFGGLGGADFLHPGLVAQAEESAGERGVQARVTFFELGKILISRQHHFRICLPHHEDVSHFLRRFLSRGIRYVLVLDV